MQARRDGGAVYGGRRLDDLVYVLFGDEAGICQRVDSVPVAAPGKFDARICEVVAERFLERPAPRGFQMNGVREARDHVAVRLVVELCAQRLFTMLEKSIFQILF